MNIANPINFRLLNSFNEAEATENADGITYEVFYEDIFYTTDKNYNIISAKDANGKNVSIKDFSPYWKAEFAATAAIFKFGKHNNSMYIT